MPNIPDIFIPATEGCLVIVYNPTERKLDTPRRTIVAWLISENGHRVEPITASGDLWEGEDFGFSDGKMAWAIFTPPETYFIPEMQPVGSPEELLAQFIELQAKDA